MVGLGLKWLIGWIELVWKVKRRRTMAFKPYVIWCPDYDYTSGGIKVMWGLYGWLLAKGVEVYMNRYPLEKSIGESIAIYPEIIQGNPIGSKTVVRYILAPLGEMALIRDGVATPGPSFYPKTDLLYSFSKLIYATDSDHTLFLPIIDTHIFKDQHKERTKTCVLFGKQPDKHLHPTDAIVIDRTYASDQEALSNTLNECKMMYVYDHRTAMTEVARLSGCPVTIIPSVYTKEQFSLYEPGLNGISWGLEEHNELDSESFRKHYLGMIKTFITKLDKFIEDTQNA